ncbi:NACHT domain- and WD repeat-containing protein 1-like isoform X1 [Pomacea canaliculata]|nr:NACHT domain- and WD repeat-containing protein 1-like isoform X1 [Pomacea canaliculata]
MADSQRTVQPWTDPPEAELRRVKTMVEDELLIKLGAKKEAIEFHPLILAQRPERPKSSVVPDYRRVKPPRQEKQQPNRNPWRCSDQALRQLTNNRTRQGPRQIQLPSASSRRTVNLRTMPACDEEYRKLRLVKLSKRDEILAEWPVYQSQAYLLKRLTFFVVPDTDELRRFSLVSSTSSIAGPEKKSAHPRPARRVLDHLTQPTLRKRPRARWRGMARQVLWNTKAAQMRMPEEIPRSEVRIYVSCTEDMSEEREFLAEVAYPELRRFCEKHGLGCHVVDLRHGINRLKNDRETFDVIDYEVKKCQQYSIGPSFVSIIGREADDRHLPGWMSKDDVLAVRSVLVKREDVVAVEALDNIYRLDSNYNPPIYLLEESQFFAETAETKVLQNVLPDVLNLLRGEGKVKDSKGFYPWSSTVREVERGLLKCLEPNRQTICLMARADNKSDTDITASTGDLGADKLRAAVSDCYKFTSSKNNLVLFNIGKKNVAYLREVCAVFLAAVTRLIESQIGHHEFDITHHMTNAADLVQHVRVARRACDGFIGCEQAVQRICDLFTDASAPRVAVVAGPEGRGKTSLVGHTAAVLSLAAPRRKLVFRTIGITLSSSTLFHTLSSVYAQVAYLYEISPHLPADINLGELLQEFRNLLQKAREKFRDKGFFVLILDGVDKLRGLQAKQLSFLVASIPAGVALLMSMSDFGPLYETMKVFANIEMIHCEPMKSDYLNSYINSFLARCGRVLKNDQVKAILNELTEENEPLVAKIAASMASRWPSHTLNDDLDISSDMEKAFNRLVQSCEMQLGLKFTRYSLSLLAASRYGLAEFEILHLISSDSELIDEIKEEIEDLSVVEGCPYQLQLSRLLWRLEPFLFEVKTEGETILKISHRTLEKVVRERFMRDGFQYHIHSRLATYFQITRRGHLLSSRDIAEGQHKDLSRYLWRTLRSVPYHLCHSHPDPKEAWKVLKSAVFTKFAWIINEIYAGFFNDFIDDMNYALETLGLDSEVLFLRQFLTSVRKTIIFNPVSLASLMAGQDLKEMAEVHRSVTEATDWLKQVNVQVLVPAAFTVEKASQLLLNTALLKTVSTLVTDAKGERVLAQHDTFLTSVEPISGEETVVASFHRGY